VDRRDLGVLALVGELLSSRDDLLRVGGVALEVLDVVGLLGHGRRLSTGARGGWHLGPLYSEGEKQRFDERQRQRDHLYDGYCGFCHRAKRLLAQKR